MIYKRFSISAVANPYSSTRYDKNKIVKMYVSFVDNICGFNKIPYSQILTLRGVTIVSLASRRYDTGTLHMRCTFFMSRLWCLCRTMLFSEMFRKIPRLMTESFYFEGVVLSGFFKTILLVSATIRRTFTIRQNENFK